MTDHVALVPDRARRNIRTILNIALSVAVVILGLVPVLLEAVEPLQEHLPGGWYLWLVGIAAAVVAVATAVQRILTSPFVEQLLQDRAPRLAAVSADGVPVITSLPATARADLATLRDFLDEGDPARDALTLVLRT
jgi:hypothetical protein